jgi:hypothetical protein
MAGEESFELSVEVLQTTEFTIVRAATILFSGTFKVRPPTLSARNLLRILTITVKVAAYDSVACLNHRRTFMSEPKHPAHRPWHPVAGNAVNPTEPPAAENTAREVTDGPQFAQPATVIAG